MYFLPTQFHHNIRNTFGDDGQKWLDSLPRTLREIRQRWNITIDQPYDLTYNYVARATRPDGEQVVIKFGLPRPELRREINALRLYNGRGMVRLIDADIQQCVMLLEQLQPGLRLHGLMGINDEQATRTAANLIKQLHQARVDTRLLRPVTEWAAGLQRAYQYTSPFPMHLIDIAQELFTDLLAAPQGHVVIHGDLHQDNVLSAQRQPWLAIDPKGMVGDPAWEVGAWLRNPWRDIRRFREPDLSNLLARRVAIFDEVLGYGRKRIIHYGIAITILSAWWSYEDNDPHWKTSLPVIDALMRMD